MKERRAAHTILVTDDSAVLRGLLQAMLESGGYRVMVAANGLAAIQSAQHAHPDAVLLDIEMPVLDGTQTCARLKADPQTAHTPVVMISTRIREGLSDVGDEDGHLWAKADACLSKPVHRGALLGCLDRLLGITPTNTVID